MFCYQNCLLEVMDISINNYCSHYQILVSVRGIYCENKETMFLVPHLSHAHCWIGTVYICFKTDQVNLESNCKISSFRQMCLGGELNVLRKSLSIGQKGRRGKSGKTLKQRMQKGHIRWAMWTNNKITNDFGSRW